LFKEKIIKEMAKSGKMSKPNMIREINRMKIEMDEDNTYRPLSDDKKIYKDNSSAYYSDKLDKTRKEYNNHKFPTLPLPSVSPSGSGLIAPSGFGSGGSGGLQILDPYGSQGLNPVLPPPILPPGFNPIVSRPSLLPSMYPLLPPIPKAEKYDKTNTPAASIMERDKLIQQMKDKTVLEQGQDITYEYLRSLENKQKRVEKLKNDLFANSQVNQELNADGVMVEKPLFVEQTNQARVNTGIGAFIRGNARRNKTGEWTKEDLMKHMIPIRTY
jgi:hypothetical protein